MSSIKHIKASELTPDPHNANKGTERGRYALETSLRKYGAGRSILVDRKGLVIVGNKTLETSVEAGMDDVIVVQTDGSKVVAVQRMDLDLTQDEKARMLAYADNRVSELNLDFDVEVMVDDLAAGFPLDVFWQEWELAELGAVVPDFAPVGMDEQLQLDQKAPVICPHCGEEFVLE